MRDMRGRPAGTLPRDGDRLRLLGRGLVMAQAGRCVECGLCTYNCPMGVDTRRYARHGLPVTDAACILCGSCVAHCPRGTLRLEFVADGEVEVVPNVAPRAAAGRAA